MGYIGFWPQILLRGFIFIISMNVAHLFYYMPTNCLHLHWDTFICAQSVIYLIHLKFTVFLLLYSTFLSLSCMPS